MPTHVLSFDSSAAAEHARSDLAARGARTHLNEQDGRMYLSAATDALTREAVQELASKHNGLLVATIGEGPDDDGFNPRIVPLASPRDLTEQERQYLEFLLVHPEAVPQLRTQAENVRVTGECDCGCHSIRLEPQATTPLAQAGPNTDTYADGTAFDLKAVGTSPNGNAVDVVLHVLDGRMVELEIWDAEVVNGRSRGELPKLASLRYD